MSQGKVFHIIEPEFDKDSKVLILGTMPSPKSREDGFYYAHPQNRFWRTLSAVMGVGELKDIDEKRRFLHKNHIALWDVLESCEIENAADASIRNPVPNKMERIFGAADILQVFTTGKKAYELYNRLCPLSKEYPAICLSSTSPANCRVKFEELIEEYSVIKKYLGKH